MDSQYDLTEALNLLQEQGMHYLRKSTDSAEIWKLQKKL
jgi:hypothetical protein